MKIKENPEDFIVKERLNLKLGRGQYAYYLLSKKQWNTQDAIRKIANTLRISEKTISYAGLKDRQAITEQYLSIFDGRKDYENLKLKDIELRYLGNGQERINTSQLQGNEFAITVREIEAGAEPRKLMPNYFDEQRFGINNTNSAIGKALVKRDFKKACKTLELGGDNHVGELQKQGRILKLYLHSYQSQLFNQILSRYVERKYKHKKISCGYEQLAFPLEEPDATIKVPLISFDLEQEGEIKEITDEVLAEEGINTKDFIIRQMPELVSKTEYRDGFTEIKNLQLGIFTNNSQKISFELQKGSYATVAIKTLFMQNL